MLSIIAAVAKNGVIGNKGKLPWHLSEDLKHFKEITMGHPIIMGRKTYQSIGGALAGRTNIVITRNRDFEAANAEIAHDLDEALDQAMAVEDLWGHDDATPEVFVIGGAEIYTQSLDRAGRIYMTEVRDTPPGDAFFPDFDKTAWRETDRQDRAQESDGGLAYSFVILDRRI